jgi:hypothetical protein
MDPKHTAILKPSVFVVNPRGPGQNDMRGSLPHAATLPPVDSSPTLLDKMDDDGQAPSSKNTR